MSFNVQSGLRVLGAAMAAAVVLSACEGGTGSANDALPLIRGTLTVKTVSQGGVCEGVRIRLTPKEFIGEANKYANNKMMVTEVAMTGPTDEAGAPMCNGTGETLPLAPGNWEFSAMLASGSYSCERNIQSDGDLSIIFIDGVDGCSGPTAAPAEGEMLMEEGATPDEVPAG